MPRECPLDLKEAISSVCFAAPRCSDLTELIQVQLLFATKYGKEFVSAATELMPDCGVNRQLIELLSIRAPSPEKKLKLLKEIAEEYEVEWDPAATETELLKTHEDLLNGPAQFVSGSKLPLPKEKHDETLYSTPEQHQTEQPDADSGIDSLDFPEVPKVAVQSSANVASAPAMSPPLQAVFPSLQDTPLPDLDPDSSKSSGVIENSPEERQLEPEEVMQERPVANKDEQPSVPVGGGDDKQFIPFIASPSLSSASFSVTQSKSPTPMPTSLSRTKSEANVDFQDVLTAAQAAAESAERAAAAARSAASLAQLRINELTKKNNQFPDTSCENPFHIDIPNRSATEENQHLDNQNLFGNSDNVVLNSPELHQASDQSSEPSTLPSFDTRKVDFDSALPSDYGFENELAPHQPQILTSMDDEPAPHQPQRLNSMDDDPAPHQPQRLNSMDDDPYLSYPNLFTSQSPTLGSAAHYSVDNSR
ncbi:hypothetical protein CJ030_MR6G009340 [Morella rubra]|uniref:IST1-like protein n=1 Tax=Morella rubra TaxID=262757 RepID=A0A6A1V9C7_9ROSI|nr:hypothetical protein CJ030_MR6G009340 [Morella rubra]